MGNYYFTFGTDERFPFQRGYVKVSASDKGEAIKLFNLKYPPRDKSGYINCAFIYPQNEWDVLQQDSISTCHDAI